MEENVIIIGPEDLNERGYKFSFYEDFTNAEKLGANSIIETFNSIFEKVKSNYVELTELVIVLNHKIFDLFETQREIASVYNDLWRRAASFAEENLCGKELGYYYRETD